MKQYPSVKAFTTIEIMIAICIVVIVATIAVPVYMNLQTQAENTTAVQMESQLNSTYANWKDSGGIVQSAAATSDILSVIGTPTPANGGLRLSPNGFVSDGGISNTISITLPLGTPDLTQSSYLPSSVVMAGDYVIASGGATPGGSAPIFTVIPASTLANMPWGDPTTKFVFKGPMPIPLSLPAYGVTVPAPLTYPDSGTLYGYSGGVYYKVNYQITNISPNIELTICSGQ
jgi:type II secretory pathway pseudopilin PulG